MESVIALYSVLAIWVLVGLCTYVFYPPRYPGAGLLHFLFTVVVMPPVMVLWIPLSVLLRRLFRVRKNKASLRITASAQMQKRVSFF